MTWIQTYTGRKLDLANPNPDDLDLDDIAHALSLICRFTGHVREFYSVAQHCVIVSSLVPPELALSALLHDATEAYIGDVSRPLKGLLPEYRAIEARLWAAIAERFGVTEAPEIKLADNIALLWERRDLLGEPVAPWAEEHLLAGVPDYKCVAWRSESAEYRWRRRYDMLTGGGAS